MSFSDNPTLVEAGNVPLSSPMTPTLSPIPVEESKMATLLPDYSNVIVQTLASLPEDAATGGMAIDTDGYLFVADIGKIPSRNGTTVYKITPEGDVSLFSESYEFNGASGNTFDILGNLYQSSFTGGTIHKITSDGRISLYAKDGIAGPVGLVFDSNGNLYVADCRLGSIQRIFPDGTSETFARQNGLNCPNGIAIDENGILYVANFSNGKILKITQSGKITVLAELPGGNNGHLAYHDNILYATDRGGNRVYAVHIVSGEVKLVAGTGDRGLDDGPGAEASFSLPNGIVISPDGSRLYINQVLDLEGSNNFPVVVRTIILNP